MSPNTHVCPWPGCQTHVSTAMWGCRFHWNALPGPLRRNLLNAYQDNIELNRSSSPEYRKAAAEIAEWILNNSVTARVSQQEQPVCPSP